MKIYNLEDTDEADGSIQAESMDSVSLPQFLVSQEKKKTCFIDFLVDCLHICFSVSGCGKNPGFLASGAICEEGN